MEEMYRRIRGIFLEAAERWSDPARGVGSLVVSLPEAVVASALIP
jgi:hypothetical protein